MANSRSLYQLEALPFSSREFHTKFTNLAGPLSLFDQEDNTDTGCENPEVERPLTPVEDAVKGSPSSFSTFAKLVHPRLCPREGISGLSIDDQRQLIGVLMVELNNIWQDVQRGPPDPFLTIQQNKELERRLTIEIVVIAQGLFAKYLDKAQKLNQRGVFSAPANLSRIKTQLALDANKSLNVLSLRRNLAADMKHPLDTSTISSRFSLHKVIGAPQNLYRPLLVRQEEDRKARTHLTREEKDQLWVDTEIYDLQRRMPHTEPSPFMPTIPQGFTSPKAQVSDTIMQERTLQERSNSTRIPFLQKEKCTSVPELFSREVVQEELGILDEGRDHVTKRRTHSASHVAVSRTSHGMDEKRFAQTDGCAALVNEITSQQLAREDLTRLLTSRSLKPVGRLQEEDESDDLPPLLQSLAHYSTKKRGKDTRERRQKGISGGDIKEEDDDDATSTASSVQSTEASSVALNRRVLDDNITEFTGEEHPQPATVSLRLPNKSVVRTSDVRVSNRVNKASLTVKKHPTVYNDLSGEIDAPTVKWLDKNLFIGEEIKEVYEEIIKTIGTDHLLFDKDDYVEKSASAVDVSLSTASSTLNKPRSERIINKLLKRPAPPPWGKDTADNWRNSPKFGGLGREDILQAKLKKVEEDGHAHKSYNSWLAWWRSTITKDDFLKYLSTQENDFMSLMFHLYDSDHESDDEAYDSDFHPDTMQMALLRENERKLAELKTLKKHYQAGLWNVNSVLLGGLGNEPELNDDELLGNAESGHQTLNSVTSNIQSVARPVVPFPPSIGGWRPSYKSSESLICEPVLTEAEKHRADSSGKVSRAVGIDAAPVSSSSTSEATLSPQGRLQSIWTHLCMPDAQRLDMAIKYSAEPYSNKLLESLTLWEVATEVIVERESLMTKLEDFERIASDPNRFFQKGSTGSSTSRIRESKTRDWFGKRLSHIESDARKAVMNVQRQFGDTVTFQGRPYLEKMNMDRTEMFYWLQQERRHQVLEREFIKANKVILKPSDLPPIEAHTML